VRFENYTAKLESMSPAEKERYLKNQAAQRKRDRDPDVIERKKVLAKGRYEEKKRRLQEEGM
jgi:hypothetical protein